MNYSFLRGKIIENCGNLKNFAQKLEISKQELSNKLNNKSSFSQFQIQKAIEILNLNNEEVAKCFFVKK